MHTKNTLQSIIPSSLQAAALDLQLEARIIRALLGIFGVAMVIGKGKVQLYSVQYSWVALP